MKKSLFTFLVILCYTTISAQNWDISLLRSINKKRSSGATAFFKVTSNSVYVIPFAYPILAFGSGKITKNNLLVRESFFSFAALGSVNVLSFSVKLLIKRPRPYLTYPDIIVEEPTKTFSFPSGHTAVAFCTATGMSLYYNKWYVTLPAYAWASSVAYSRMYLGKHYPTDLIGGIILGTGIPLLFHFCKPVNRAIDKAGKFVFRY